MNPDCAAVIAAALSGQPAITIPAQCVRPLTCIQRQQAKEYAAQNGIRWRIVGRAGKCQS
jgi:hypothetical protein